MQFKSINIGYLLFDKLRNYFSVNKLGNLSILYRYLLSCAYPLQSIFDDFDIFRIRQKYIINCTWTVGQLQNVLNNLLDSEQKRIVIENSNTARVIIPAAIYVTTESVTQILETIKIIGTNYEIIQ